MKKVRNKIAFIAIFLLSLIVFSGAQVFATQTANKTALAREINKQYESASRDQLKLTQTDYTTLSWNNYIVAIEAAQDAEENEEALQSECDTAVTNLQNARAALVFAGQADLDTLLAQVIEDARVQSDYTTSSWNTFTSALAMSETTNSEVVSKTNAINSAIASLTFAGQADLDSAKSVANSKTESDYTSASWQTLTDALALAETTNAELLTKTTAIDSAISGLVFAGQANLDTAKSLVSSKTASDYTSETWGEVTDAMALPETTNSEVVSKTSAINQAIADLVTIQSVLDGLKTTASGLISADYTPSTWSNLTTAVALPETNNTEKNEKISAISLALDGLIFAGLQDLETAITNAQSLNSSDYTSASWQTLAEALVLSDSTNDEIVAKTNAIEIALQDLVFALQSDLDQAIYNVSLLNSTDYTSDTWGNITNALALSVSSNSDAEYKINEINNSISGLEFAAADDLANLLYSISTSYSSSDYTYDSWYDVDWRISGMPETSNDEILAKISAINTAISNLVFANLSELEDAKSRVSYLQELEYTSASWTDLQNAYILPESTNNEIINKINSINSAIDNLVFEALADLETAKAASAIDRTEYSSASLETLDNALNMSEDSNFDIETKTTAINSALSNLVLIYSEELISSKNTASAKVSTDYTVDTWAELATALALPESNASERYTKYNAIDSALLGLEFAGQAELDDIKDGIQANLTAVDYTTASWDFLVGVLSLTENTNSEVITKISELENALLGLEFAGQADFDYVEAIALSKTSTDYTTATWDAIVTAMALPETTNSEIVAKTTAIENALTGLVFAGQSALDSAKAIVDQEQYPTDYTFASWGAVEDAMALPETTNAEIVAKAAAIESAFENLVLDTDLTPLTRAINMQYQDKARRKTMLLTEEDYTVASWSTYIEYISDMKGLEYLDTVRQSQIYAILEIYSDVIDSLEFAGQAALETIKVIANEKVSTDYTSATWTPLTEALALTETTNAEVIAKTTAINNALSELVFAGKANLDSAIAAAAEYDSQEYSTASWTVLTDALAMSETTNAGVLAKISAINNAIEGLTYAGQAALDTAVSNVSLKTSTDYTTTSWAAVTSALTLTENNNAQIVAKTTAINTALGALVFNGKANLDTAKATASTKVLTDYTTASWTALTEALAMSETTNAGVVSKTTAINSAISGLVFAGQANLNTAKATAGAKTSTNYTTSSWNTLVAALALPETTNAQVVSKTTAINNAVNTLVFAGQANLNTAKANAASKVKASYTTASWNTLTEALALPETTNAQIVTKTNAINSAISGLKLAAVKYKVTATVGLNCRASATTSSKKVGFFKYNTVINIYEVKNGWGRTDLGWVSMSYLAKV